MVVVDGREGEGSRNTRFLRQLGSNMLINRHSEADIFMVDIYELDLLWPRLNNIRHRIGFADRT